MYKKICVNISTAHYLMVIVLIQHRKNVNLAHEILLVLAFCQNVTNILMSSLNHSTKTSRIYCTDSEMKIYQINISK